MKYLFTVLMVMFFFNQFAQKKKDEPKPQVRTLKIDSLLKDIKDIYFEQVKKIDSLIQKPDKKEEAPPSTNDIQDSEELKLTTTSIGKSQWSITNFGGYSELYPEEQDQIRDFLRCVRRMASLIVPRRHTQGWSSCYLQALNKSKSCWRGRNLPHRVRPPSCVSS